MTTIDYLIVIAVIIVILTGCVCLGGYGMRGFSYMLRLPPLNAGKHPFLFLILLPFWMVVGIMTIIFVDKYDLELYELGG